MVTQTYAADAAHPAPSQSGGIFLACSIALGAFLFYAVQAHLVTDAFVWFMSQFFDSFRIKSSSIIADIAILTIFCLSCFGLFRLFKDFFALTVAVVIIAVLVVVFLGGAK